MRNSTVRRFGLVFLELEDVITAKNAVRCFGFVLVVKLTKIRCSGTSISQQPGHVETSRLHRKMQDVSNRVVQKQKFGIFWRHVVFFVHFV